MNLFVSIWLGASVAILVLLAAAVTAAISVAVAGGITALVRSWRHASDVIARTQADLSILTDCAWCMDTGINAVAEECTCTGKCPEIAWCWAEWNALLATREHI